MNANEVDKVVADAFAKLHARLRRKAVPDLAEWPLPCRCTNLPDSSLLAGVGVSVTKSLIAKESK